MISRAKFLATPLTIIVVLLSACTNSSFSAKPSTTTTRTPENTPARNCQAQDLQVSFVSTSAATSLVGGRFHVINISKQPCLIKGYPSMRALDSKRKIISLDIRDGGVTPLGSAYDNKPKLVELHPKRFAIVLAEWGDVGTYPGSCPKVAKLFFKLPGLSAELPVNVQAKKTIDSTFSPCLGKVNVSPVEVFKHLNS